jgi:predicted metal-dependent hydrolase
MSHRLKIPIFINELCQMTSPPPLQAGINFFNEGRYFEAHEVWEDLWRETEGPLRRFYQGLVQAAVGLHHFGRGNKAGGNSQLRKAVVNLSTDPAGAHGLDGGGLIRQLEAVLTGSPAETVRITRLK